ncbi:MAG: NosD domain-containing protein [Candidatus Methanogasteraceae archaeon]
MEDSSNNTLTDNTANSNNMFGIVLGAAIKMAEGVGSNNTSNNDYGIGLGEVAEMAAGASNNTLANNNASGNDYGIALYDSSDDNTLANNNASDNGVGIVIEDSSNNTLASNTLSNNNDHDILIEDSPSNTFADNTLNGTTISFTHNGSVSLKGEGSPAADPTGWRNISKFINATNQSAGAWLYLNFSYSDSDLTGTMVESSLTVRKHDGTKWVKDGWDNGRYLDTTGNVVGANITSFSVFAPMGAPLHHINVTPTSKTLGINGSQDFIARGYAQDGAEISGCFAFEWAISDIYIGSLTEISDTATNFTADHAGRAHITASNGSVTSDQVLVTVDAAEPTNETVKNGTAIVTSGDANVTCNFGDDVTGWINITAIGNATNSSEVNSSDPRYGLGSGDKTVSGVTVNVSDNIRKELKDGNGTIRIRICYNTTTLTALGIDASTLAIWKYDNVTEKWVKQPSTRSGTCVYVDVDHLCTYGLVGSKTTPSGGSNGGSGTYPPGWYGTPTPVVTATNATATDAPPGERVTPAPTKAKPAAAKATAPAAEGTAAEDAKKGAPGFTATFVIAGMLAVAYAMMRRRG